MNESLSEVQEFLQEMLDDTSVPQSVRSKLQKIKEYLIKDSSELAVKVSRALDEIETITNDQNIPNYVRTQLYSISSALECIQ
jgi:uncharacterized protein (UPF0147 family)